MEFRILGPLEVVDGGEAAPLGGPKQRTVLVHLLLRANRLVSLDELIDYVWGDAPPPAARSSLHSYVSHLRRAVGTERLEGGPRGYVLHATPEEIDSFHFERLLCKARGLAASDGVSAIPAYAEALAVWRGPALADLATQHSLQSEIARLEELKLSATEERIAAEIAAGHHAEAIPELTTLVGLHPFREKLWEQLMVALYRAGRQHDALSAYGRARRLLADELGVDPSPDLQRLHQGILRQDAALELVGRPLRGYRLLELIGEGGFGVVHRAFQPQVGREVAVKIIHPRLANDAAFIRRFEVEAQLVARLEHPHIVPLYDFWREPDGAYLVMRYLRGGNLRETLAKDRLDPDQTARLVDQVALALATAHRNGVVHRDVKPANILFDEDGNAYLSDFGIAKDVATLRLMGRDASSGPSAYYLSPEEIRGEPVTAHTDVYGLGVLLYEALAGRHPFADTPAEKVAGRHLRDPLPPIGMLVPGLPEGVTGVIARATAKEPTQRYGEATDVAAAFRDALLPATRTANVLRTEIRNPYKGLRPFEQADAPDFFGREALVAELLRHLGDEHRGRFIALVGPSGSGKSSAVSAGVIPALRRGALPGSDRWFATEMHPGTHPFEELASALTRIAVQAPSDLVGRLERGDEGLAEVAAELVPPGGELLLVIDQFEEVFTLLDDDDRRAGFLRTVATATTHPASVVRVVITLRADLYDKPLNHPAIAHLVKAGTVTLAPLRPEELERAVAGPAERVGVTVDPALMARIATDIADQHAALPLLQYALTEAFDRAGGSALTPDVYDEIGGMSGALARRAEELYERLSEAGKRAARQLFLRLVTLGEEGRDDTRRRVLRVELTSLELERDAMEDVIDSFGARRLLSFDRDPATRGPTVEVAHEALLREWVRLRGWIEAARQDVRAHRRLAAAAREWTQSGRDPAYLLRGTSLSRSETWASSSGLALSADERAFLDASVAQGDAERAEEEERARREQVLERKSVLRLRALLAVFAVAAVAAGILTTFAFAQRNSAEKQARMAAARELAAAAVANLGVDPDRSILLALEAVDATRIPDGIVSREAEEALHRAVRESRLRRTIPHGGYGLAVSADGSRFATTGSEDADNTAALWDAATGRKLLVVAGPEVGPASVTLSPDDRMMATTHNDGTVRLWDTATGEKLRTLEGDGRPLGNPAFRPDGRAVAAGAANGTTWIWDVADGERRLALHGPDGMVTGTAFSPDGSRVATAGYFDATARLWDVATGDELMILRGHEWPVTDVTFDSSGTHIATTSADGTVRIWDARSGGHLRTFAGPVSFNAIEFSPDGTRVAVAGNDGIARVWDAVTGRELLILPGHAGGVANLAFTDDGQRLVTSGLDDTTRIWGVDATGARDWVTVPAAERIYVGVTFSPDGTRFAAPAEPAGVTIWDTKTGKKITALSGHESKLTTVAFSPDGRKLAAASDATATPPVWDVESGQLLFTLKGHEEPARTISFSSDGTRLVTGSFDATVRVWDVNTGEQLAVLPRRGVVVSAVFSPDDRFILIGEERGDVTVWNAATFEKVRTFGSHTQAVDDVTFGPGTMVATASDDGTAKVWDFKTGDEHVTLRGHGGIVNQVAISPDGTRIATASDDATTKLWDTSTGRLLLTLYGHQDLVFGVDFSPDGRLLATASPDGTAALHLLPIDDFVELARERVTRSLTDDECREYLHVAECGVLRPVAPFQAVSTAGHSRSSS